MEEKILTEEEIDKRVEDLKENIRKNKLSVVKLDTSLYTPQQLKEYKNKKDKNRRRAKIQKECRKKNRKK